MTDPADPSPLTPEEADRALMGEYVLGLLSAEEARRVEDRLSREAHLRALHAEWQAALAPLAAGRDVVPPDRLRAAIETRLFPARRGVGIAKWLGLFGIPAAVFALALLALQPGLVTPPADLRAEIGAEDSALRLAATVRGDALTVERLTGTARPGRTLELWLIAGEAAPVSLGLLPERGPLTVELPAAPGPGTVLAVSDEPPGGSPTGAPTGEVLAAGPLTEL